MLIVAKENPWPLVLSYSLEKSVQSLIKPLALVEGLRECELLI